MSSTPRAICLQIHEAMLARQFDAAAHAFRVSDGASQLLFDDLGDYLPFILYLGETAFCETHVSRIVSTLPSLPVQKTLKGLPAQSIYEYGDFLHGLLHYSRLTGDQTATAYLEQLTLRLIRQYRLDRDPISFRLCPTRWLSVPIPILENGTGFFVELLLELHTMTGERRYREVALRLLDGILADPLFRRERLLPEFTFKGWLRPFSPRSQVRLMKTNTNSLFGLLAAHRLTGEARLLLLFEEWVSAIIEKLAPDGVPVQCCNVRRGRLELLPQLPLTASFAMIDVICDYTHFTRDRRFLEAAERMAASWMQRQGQTGLFPALHNGTDSDLDANTDMAVALAKLSQLTDVPRYLEAAQRALDGLETHHLTDRGLVLSVAIDDGRVVRDVIKTKFNYLYFKRLVLFDSGYRPYDSALEVYDLLRDR
ncbi:hypothetical protein JYT15_00930 [Acidimicrobium ferrooxidans]|nr:hypothetical protein [Acidimicrobium ferrooxidans]